MKTMLRLALLAVVTLACALPAPRPLAAQSPEPRDRFSSRWDVLIRPRTGFFLPRLEYGEGLSLMRRPTAGIEVLTRPKFSWYGVRVLLERGAAWRDAHVPDWFDRGSSRPQRWESLMADVMLYPFPGQEIVPYLFAGGGAKAFAVDGSESSIFFPFSFHAFERKPALHAGIGFEVPLKPFLVAMEVGDYYGEVMDFGMVHDLHVSILVAYTEFGALFKALRSDREDELRPPEADRR